MADQDDGWKLSPEENQRRLDMRKKNPVSGLSKLDESEASTALASRLKGEAQMEDAKAGKKSPDITFRGSMKHGGDVNETGMYQLHKGEKVIPAMNHPHAGHGFTHTKVEWFNDGSGTVHHVHADGPHKDVKHAVGSLDDVHDSFQKHLNHQEEDRLEEKVHPGIHDEIKEMAGKE